jgi:Nif-specific regulatory protein
MAGPHAKPDAGGLDAEEVVISGAAVPLALDPADVTDADSVRRLVLLYNLAHAITAETDDRRVFQTILSAVSSLLDVERAFIALLDGDRLAARAAYKVDLGPDPAAWPVSTTMLRRVMDEGVSLLTTDALHDARYGRAPSVDLHNIRSVICCPLGAAGRPQGVIYADNRVAAGAFSRSDLAFLHALSHYAYLAVESAAARRRIAAEKELAEARLDALRREVEGQHDVVAASRDVLELYGTAKRAARKDVPVLITGETGTGKEVFAHLVHASSPRAAGPFVAVHLSALPHALVESELFGHEKGAFTGADARRIGRFELARGGTLFLDEIQDIPAEVQPKLLRVLEQRTFERLGGNETLRTDVRIVCACNRDPNMAVADGTLRADLFYRLSGVTIAVPPLRDRPQDIEPLLRHFLHLCGSEKTLDDAAMVRLKRYAWPGNVRELKHCVEALDVLVEGPVIRMEDLPERMRGLTGPEAVGGFEPIAVAVERLERDLYRRAYELADGNNEEAMRLLGVARATYFKRKKLFGLG